MNKLACFALLALVGCAQQPSVSPVVAVSGLASEPMAASTPVSTPVPTEAPTPAPTTKGSATMTIKWPDRTIQLIPQSTTELYIAAYREGEATPEASASVVRPVDAATSSVTLRLEAGTKSIEVQAWDASRSVVALGTASVAILPNQVSSVRITLIPTN